MNISNLIIYFITGGLFTTIIAALEESGQRTLSGLATLIPVFTLVAYFFIGQTQGSTAVSQHAKWVLVGTSCIVGTVYACRRVPFTEDRFA